MEPETLLHAANFSTLLTCMVLKFPQMFALVRARSSAGLSLTSLVLELTGFIVFLTYQVHHGYPPPTYLEYPILIAQDVLVLLLVLRYAGRLGHAPLYAALFAGGWKLLTLEPRILDLAMTLCTALAALSKFFQLQLLWKHGHAGQVSGLSWALATYSCLARIYTTSVTTGDRQVLVRFVLMALLNLWVLLTVLHYQKHARRAKKHH
ncbi:solute carrier family 66 member 3 isoform 1-T1 [Menidia menidia]